MTYIERDGFTVTVFYDTDAESPAGWDTVGTLAYSTHNASVGDLPSDPYGIGAFTDDCPMCIDGEFHDDFNDQRSKCERCDGTGYVTDGRAIAARLHDAIACIPVYAYDGQGGTVIGRCDNWEDANGWIYATAESVKTCMGDTATTDQIHDAMLQELESWEQWAQGDVYGVVVTAPDGRTVESCWGFYGHEYALVEAESMLDAEIAYASEQTQAIDRMMRQ